MAEVNKRNSVFAAMGAASGLGNAVRFPALCTTYGCSFFVPYALCLAVVCFPVLCAELRLGKSGGGGKIWRIISGAASVNSLLISLYYFVITVKLGSAGAECAGCGSTLAFALAFCAALAAVFFMLRGGARALSFTGKLSLILSASLFIGLAAFGVVQGKSVFAAAPFAPSQLLHGAIWSDALGQSLLSLSLAAGVMPTFARSLPKNFSVKKTAFLIIAANFSGCVLSSFATLPYVTRFPAEGGLSRGVTIFPQIVGAVSQTPAGYALFGAVIYGVTFSVALHSLCSLALPVISRFRGNAEKFVPILFCIICAVLFPLFSYGELSVTDACDRMACSICSTAIAFAECLYFSLRGGKNFLLAFICTPVCGALFLISFCGARFSAFLPLAKICAYLWFFAVLSCAAAPFICRRLKFFSKKSYPKPPARLTRR